MNIKRLSMTLLAGLLALPLCSALFQGVHADPVNVDNNAAGYHIGRSGSDLIGFYGATPVAQQSGTNDLISSLYNLGFLSSGTSATPLNLHNGALQVGTLTISGTSYGGSIQSTTFVNPTVTGTMALGSATLTGATTLSGTYTAGGGTAFSVVAFGSGTLASGTATVANAKAVTGAYIFPVGIGTTNAGFLSVGTINSGTSFGVNSSNASDARVFSYFIIK